MMVDGYTLVWSMEECQLEGLALCGALLMLCTSCLEPNRSCPASIQGVLSDRRLLAVAIVILLCRRFGLEVPLEGFVTFAARGCRVKTYLLRLRAGSNEVGSTAGIG